MSRRLPLIHRVRGEDIGPFHQEHLDLEFSNGERRRFERMVSRGHGAVVVVPMLDDATVCDVNGDTAAEKAEAEAQTVANELSDALAAANTRARRA